jgi:hypothetical protein
MSAYSKFGILSKQGDGRLMDEISRSDHNKFTYPYRLLYLKCKYLAAI